MATYDIQYRITTDHTPKEIERALFVAFQSIPNIDIIDRLITEADVIDGRMFGMGKGLPITFVPSDNRFHDVFDVEHGVKHVSVRVLPSIEEES